MAKWSTIPAYEVHNSRREWFDGDGRFAASVTLMCNWEDRFILAQDLYTSQFGGTQQAASTGGYHPRRYPDAGGDSGVASGFGLAAPSMNKVGVTSVQIRSWAEAGDTLGTSGERQVFNYKTTAFLDVQYGRLYNIEETIDFDVEVVTQSYLDFRWKTKAFPKDLGYVHELEVPAITLHSAILSRDFVGLAPGDPQSATRRPNLNNLFVNVGKTNTEAYTSIQLGRTFKKGTLLMLEPEVRPSIDMQNLNPSNLFGSKGFAVTVKFLYKPGDPDPQNGNDEDTHNLFWRPSRPVGGIANPTSRGNWDRLIIPTPGVQNISSTWKDYKPFLPSTQINSHWLIASEPPLIAG